MATIARHVIANDYSEDSHDTLSSVETGVHTPSTISEDTREDAREDSPLSSCSGQDQMESTLGVSHCVCACVCVCMRVRACVCVRVQACHMYCCLPSGGLCCAPSSYGCHHGGARL